jgi:hypothetical protein
VFHAVTQKAGVAETAGTTIQPVHLNMTCPVFISYARIANIAQAQALKAKLGELAFLDTTQIDDGDPFPQRLLEGLMDACVVVIFASRPYSESRVCRLEMRLAMAGDPASSNLIVVRSEGALDVLNEMPLMFADSNALPASATNEIEALVRRRLTDRPTPLRQRLSEAGAERLKSAFLNEANMLEPRSLQGIVCSLPQGASGHSIGSRFIGRGEEMRDIHRVLEPGNGLKEHVIGRLVAGGGFGKTRLAAEYLHRYGPRYYSGGLFWVNAASSSIDGELWRILRSLDESVPDLPTMREKKRDVRRELENVLRKSDRPVLYVVDNIPEAAPGQDARSIAEFCPALGSVTVLATSRQDTREEGVTNIPIGALGRDASVFLLTDSVAGFDRLSWTDWGRIAEWVGDLPLALDLLNRCMSLTTVAPEELLDRIGLLPGAISELDRLASALKGQVVECARLGIAQALQISFEKLDEGAQVAAIILAQFSPAPIPKALFEAMPEECTQASVRAALSSRHFVTYAGDQSFGVMHRLMVDFLRHAAAEWLPEAAALSMLSMARSFPIADDAKNWPQCSALLPHAMEVLKRKPFTIEGFDDEGWLTYREGQLSERVDRYLEESRAFEESKQLWNAMSHFHEDRRSATTISTSLPDLKPEIGRRLMREALEQPANENLQPLRDAVRQQPSAIQDEIRAEARESTELAGRLRDLLMKGDSATREKEIGDLISIGIGKFPIHLQSDIDAAYLRPALKASEGFIQAFMDSKRKEEARKSLSRMLDVVEPAARPPREKRRWSWLRPWGSH